MRNAKKFTAACSQPDTTPDLTLGEPSIVAGPRADVVVYEFRDGSLQRVMSSGCGS